MTRPLVSRVNPFGLAVVALTAAVLAAGFLRIGSRSIWLDESTSIWYALHTWRDLLDVFTLDPNMSAYYAVLWFWRHIFGDGVVAMRSLSVLFAAMTIPAVYAVGARLFGRPAGLIAALLVALNAFLLRYAQEVRSYALVTLLVTLSSWFLIAQLDGKRTRSAQVGYVVVSAAAIHAHFFAAYVLVAHAAYIALFARHKARSRVWLWQYAAIGALSLPIAVASVRASSAQIDWIPESDLADLRSAVTQLAGESSWLLLVFVVTAVLGLLLAFQSPALGARLAFPAVWFLVPVALSFSVSELKPMFLPKYLIACVPALGIFAGGVVVNVRPRLVGAAIVTALILLSIAPFRAWYDRPPIQDWSALTRYVLDGTDPGDALLIRDDLPFAYYANRSGSPQPLRIASTDLASASHSRVWLIADHPEDPPSSVRQALAAGGYKLARRKEFWKDMKAELFVREDN